MSTLAPEALASAALTATLATLGPDERAVIAAMAECGTSVEEQLMSARRAADALKKYGALDLATDPRDMAAEAIAELVDARFYVAALLVRLAGRAGSMSSRLLIRELNHAIANMRYLSTPDAVARALAGAGR